MAIGIAGGIVGGIGFRIGAMAIGIALAIAGWIVLGSALRLVLQSLRLESTTTWFIRCLSGRVSMGAGTLIIRSRGTISALFPSPGWTGC
jgi:hypothetical protein